MDYEEEVGTEKDEVEVRDESPRVSGNWVQMTLLKKTLVCLILIFILEKMGPNGKTLSSKKHKD